MYISWIFIKLKKRVAVCWGLFTIEVYSTLYTFMYSYIYVSVSIVQLLARLSFYVQFSVHSCKTKMFCTPGCSHQLFYAAPYSTQLFYTAVCYTKLFCTFSSRNQLPYAAACKNELLCELYGGLSCSMQLHATKQSNQFCNWDIFFSVLIVFPLKLFSYLYFLLLFYCI